MAKTSSGWGVVGASIRGASHVRRDLPNEDAIGWKSVDGALAVAVADGHGSERCPRAAEGSQLAVSVTLDALLALAGDDLPSPAQFDQLRVDIAQGWLDALPEPNPLLFGTTVVALVMTPGWVVAVQLGDGDILMVFDSGAVTPLIGADPLLLGNQTTGLATEDAAGEIRIAAQLLLAPPKLLLIATDGYSNSFASEDGFHQAAWDFSVMVEEDGLASLEADLTDWLNETSALGSGDDISLALVAPDA